MTPDPSRAPAHGCDCTVCRTLRTKLPARPVRPSDPEWPVIIRLARKAGE